MTLYNSELESIVEENLAKTCQRLGTSTDSNRDWLEVEAELAQLLLACNMLVDTSEKIRNSVHVLVQSLEAQS